MSDNEKLPMARRAARKEEKKPDAPAPAVKTPPMPAGGDALQASGAARAATFARSLPSGSHPIIATTLTAPVTGTAMPIRTAAVSAPEARSPSTMTEPKVGEVAAVGPLGPRDGRSTGQKPHAFPHAAAIRVGVATITRRAIQGLSLAVAVTAGYAAHMYLVSQDRSGASAVAFSIGQSQAELRQLSGDLRALKESVASLGKTAAATRQVVPVSQAAQTEDLRAVKERLSALAEGVERMKQESGAKLTQVSSQLDRVEKLERDPGRVAALVDRLDRIERQTATLTTAGLQAQSASGGAQIGITAQNGAAQAGSGTQAKVEESLQQRPIDGWVLRDIFDGMALIEGRRGILEIAPGQTVAGIGRVEKFERRGRQWVVVTDRGIIPSLR